MKNPATFYILSILILGGALWFVLIRGGTLQSGKIPELPNATSAISHPGPAHDGLAHNGQDHFLANIATNMQHPLAILIMQILCIMLVARIFGYLMTRIGQPSVIGEIVAGIALGPSLLGYLFPEFSTFLFPADSLRRLQVLSQIGLVFFMFIIGMELDIGILKKRVKNAILVSHTSFAFSYFLGVALAYFLYVAYAPAQIQFIGFALFTGIAMSMTAFPVLARIIQERNLTRTPLGTFIIACAAVDDITAWCLLALVVAIVSAGGMIGAIGSIVLTVAYILCMGLVIRPLLHRLAVKYDSPESINRGVVAAIFGILFFSSYLTEIIGIHAFFGAFVAGLIMPPQREFKRILAEKIEDVSLVALLPLFFVFTGLRTEIGLLQQSNLWGVCLLIIGVAVLGKFVGATIAAKVVGQKWKDSLLIGILMNTRGLMELVVLNIGYDLGILSAEIFTMMVIMALVTTMMAGPALRVLEFLFRQGAGHDEQTVKEGFHVLIPFGAPQAGRRLLELAHGLRLGRHQDLRVTAIHFSASADISMAEARQNKKEAFGPIGRSAKKLGLTINKIFRVTDNMEREMIATIRENPHDIILVGSSRELFKNDKTGGKVGSLIHDTNFTVGVLIDRGFKQISRAIFVVSGNHDQFLLPYAKKFTAGQEKNSAIIVDSAKSFATGRDEEKFIVAESLPENREEYDMVIISLDFWEGLKKNQGPWLDGMPSVLIVKK